MQPCDSCYFYREIIDDPNGKQCRFPWLDPQPVDILKKLCRNPEDDEELYEIEEDECWE